jgi:hypothetical protein
MGYKKFDMVYRNGTRIRIYAKECEIEREGALISAVQFNHCKKWAAFIIEDLLAIVEA